MKKILIVDLPDGIELIRVKVSNSTNEYGEFSYLIPIIEFKELTLPSEEEVDKDVDTNKKHWLGIHNPPNNHDEIFIAGYKSGYKEAINQILNQ